MNPTVQVRRLLDAHDFSLVRQRKHEVYRSPHGITFVRPHTGSDSRRGDWNSLADLKRLLRRSGLPIEIREPEAAPPSLVCPRRDELQEQPNTEIVPPAEPTPAPGETKPAPPPLTKAEQKKLARWERNYAAKERRQEAFLAPYLPDGRGLRRTVPLRC